MDVRQLRYFAGIAEAGSVSAAARRLGVAQPALSQHVLALERELGAVLLQRGPRGVRLTDAGGRLLDHALVVLRDLERAREAVAGAAGPPEGRVAVGLPTTLAPVLGLELLQAALHALPGVTLHLVESHSGFLREWLEAGRLDMALLFNVAAADGLEAVPLLAEDLHLVGPGPGAGAGEGGGEGGVGGGGRPGPPVALAALHGLDLVMAGPPHDLRRSLDDAMLRATGRAPVLRAEIDSLHTLKRLAAAGLAHTVLPLATVLPEVAAGSLSARPIVEPAMPRHAALATLPLRPPTRARQAVAELLLGVADRLIAGGSWPGRRLLPPRGPAAAAWAIG